MTDKRNEREQAKRKARQLTPEQNVTDNRRNYIEMMMKMMRKWCRNHENEVQDEPNGASRSFDDFMRIYDHLCH